MRRACCGSRPKPRSCLQTCCPLQQLFGFTAESVAVVLKPMAISGKEPVGSMGDDTPKAVLSRLPRPIYHYFKQRFAEVTNPPIDPLREQVVMSLRTLLGRRRSILEETPEHARLLVLIRPSSVASVMAALRRLRRPASGALLIPVTTVCLSPRSSST